MAWSSTMKTRMGCGPGVDMPYLQLQRNVSYDYNGTTRSVLDARASSQSCRALCDRARYEGGRDLPRGAVVRDAQAQMILAARQADGGLRAARVPTHIAQTFGDDLKHLGG